MDALRAEGNIITVDISVAHTLSGSDNLTVSFSTYFPLSSMTTQNRRFCFQTAPENVQNVSFFFTVFPDPGEEWPWQNFGHGFSCAEDDNCVPPFDLDGNTDAIWRTGFRRKPALFTLPWGEDGPVWTSVECA